MCSELLSTCMSAGRDAVCIPSSRNNKEARVAGVELYREEMLWGLGANQRGKKAEGKFCKAL